MIDLANFKGLEHLKQLFWSDLNYERKNQALRRSGWNEAARAALAEDPVLFAVGGSDESFHVVYGRLKAELLLTDEREVINELLSDHPYALFVFSNNQQDHWHFVNVKVGEKKDTANGDMQRRRLFRRITIAPPYTTLHTATERIQMLDLDTIAERDLFGLSPLAIQKRLDEAFDVEAVTKAFFGQYHQIFQQAEAAITGIEGDARRLFTQKLFNRLMFIIFLENKGWLKFGDRTDYVRALWTAHRREKQNDPRQNFYEHRLKYLFFLGLNTQDEIDIINAVGGSRFLQTLIGDVPYLNGGLFEKDADDDNPNILVPDAVLQSAVDDLFYRFNFTVVESTPLDVEVAVDPEMLGKMFEELVTGRHESGSYYTPKPVVSFMGREALKGYLATACPQEPPAAIAAFVDEHLPEKLIDPEPVLEALRKVRICDPACGSGAYLLGMLHELLDLRAALFKRSKLDSPTVYDRKLEIIQNNVYGVDIDPFAVSIARLRLWLSLIVDFEDEKPPPLPNLDYKIEVGDSLIAPDPSGGLHVDLFRRQQVTEYYRKKADYLKEHNLKRVMRREIDTLRDEIIEWARADKNYKGGFDWAVEFAEVFADGGFDIVLANPPYVRQELIKDLKPILKQTFGELFSGTADLYVFFYLRGLQLLKNKGMLIFISSNKWLRAAYGQKLRAYLASITHVQSITDFGELPVFTAATFPLIFIAQKQVSTSPFRFTQVKSLEPPYPDVKLLIDEHGRMLAQEFLSGKNWTLVSTNNANVLNHITEANIPLQDYTHGLFYAGIKTGKNKAFWINDQKRSELISLDPRSAELIKPLIVGDDVRRWRIDRSGMWIIFTRRGVNIDHYPAIKTHLMNWYASLTPKRSSSEEIGRKPGSYKWYEIQDNVAFYEDFEKPKIIYPDIAKVPRFAYDTTASYVDMTAFIIPTDDLYLLGILNSNVVWHFLKQKAAVLGDTEKGGRLRLKRIYVSTIPIPQPVINLRNEIQDIARELVSVEGIGSKAVQLETSLNQLVYQAYDLTDDEIGLIENSGVT